MTLEPVRAFSQRHGRRPQRGGLLEWAMEIASHTRENPEVMQPDVGGQFQFFRRGPYCDSSAALEAARTVASYGQQLGGRFEAFGKTVEYQSFVYARFISGEVKLEVVREA